ncbi:carboxylesterase family protein [Actinosynnema sp. NPDC050436]|uniref:carboxylesterase/lipase family protein n=1 Tax=Actinosynnema sp. NPDC050436 TaxID=3155659 RepID=UPI0033C8D618
MKWWSVPSALLVLAGTLVGPVAGATGDPGRPVVRTENGAVRGSSDGRTAVFKGIPYADPPVGELRWRDPRPVRPWHGVRDAGRPGPVCAQDPGEVPDGSVHEDCLYLNVTRPENRSGGPAPVIVWLHGGGFYMGAGSNYDPARMVERGGVVVVTFNYRLGVFGFFGHPGLAGSGQFGLADQQAALRWVRRNVAAFGGDPGRVTVAGQSAGAISACAHLTSRPAAGLVDRVVSQSGSCDLSWAAGAEYRAEPADAIFEPLAGVEERGRRAAGELGCAGTAPAVVLDCLRGLPVEVVRKVHKRFIQPAHGNGLLPDDPVAALASGRFHRVPVLTGQTRDEATLATSIYDRLQPMGEQTYREVMAEAFGARLPEVEAEYPRSAYGSAALAWSAVVTDRKWTCTQLTTSRRLARHVPVYHYEFADPQAPLLTEPPMPMGAYHSSDLWSLFVLGGRPHRLTPEQQVLADRMVDYWTSFAATGDPNGPGRPHWPRFDVRASTPHVQDLAPGEHGIGPVDLATRHHCRFWAGMP